MISVPILIRILKTVEHINVNKVTENHSYAPNVARGSNGCNKDAGTLTQKNVKTLHHRNKWAIATLILFGSALNLVKIVNQVKLDVCWKLRLSFQGITL